MSKFVLKETFQGNASIRKSKFVHPVFNFVLLWFFLMNAIVVWQILKCFAGTISRAQTQKLGGVDSLHIIVYF